MVAALAVQQPDPKRLHLVTEFRGAVGRLFREHSDEIVISGPAGTGKTRSILEWLNLRCAQEPLRVLFLRKTLESLKTSALVTFTEKVLHDFDGKRSAADGVTYFGGNHIRPASFTYEQTGSTIVIGGMDNPTKILSTEYDIIYVNECTELTLDEWERLGNRTDRPDLDQSRPASLLLGDCNPDAPSHWIKTREKDGHLQLWLTTHKDNPAMWDRFAKEWTASGERYIERLDRLTGVRFQRLKKGLWVSADGQVYDQWNPVVHIAKDRRIVPTMEDIPYDWPRYWVVDFGYIHPFVWQAWVRKPDGELVMYREIYMTRRLVSEHASMIMQLTANEPKPTAIITDHDAEDRATFEAATGLRTIAAKKNVSGGIQAVANRLGRVDDDGGILVRPRVTFLPDSLVERDTELAERGHPTSTIEEFGSYVWNLAANRRKGEEPLKEFDHGMDAMRYLVAYFDLEDGGTVTGPLQDSPLLRSLQRQRGVR